MKKQQARDFWLESYVFCSWSRWIRMGKNKLIVLVLYKKKAAAPRKSPDTKLCLDIYTYMSGARKSTWRNGKSNFKLNELTYTVYQLYTLI